MHGNGQREHTVCYPLAWAALVKHKKRQGLLYTIPIADVIESHPTNQRMLGSYTIDRFLHLAMPTVASLYGIGGRGKKRIIKEGKGLLQVWAEKLLEGFAYLLETSDSPAKLAEFVQGCLRPATAVEQAVHFIHDLPKRSQLPKPPSDPGQGLPLGKRQMVLHEQQTILE